MSVLELKGELLEMISSVHSEEILLKLKKNFKKVTATEEVVTTAYSLTPEQEAELMISLEESYDEANMLDIEESKKLHARWLKR
jgi:F0F1-type ATP synthase delta subunit